MLIYKVFMTAATKLSYLRPNHDLNTLRSWGGTRDKATQKLIDQAKAKKKRSKGSLAVVFFLVSKNNSTAHVRLEEDCLVG